MYTNLQFYLPVNLEYKHTPGKVNGYFRAAWVSAPRKRTHGSLSALPSNSVQYPEQTALIAVAGTDDGAEDTVTWKLTRIYSGVTGISRGGVTAISRGVSLCSIGITLIASLRYTTLMQITSINIHKNKFP
jgi:hypothetical protein